MASPRHVIILGCGRSGTSIFGELFSHLPEYQYFSEPPFAEFMKLNIIQPTALKVPKESDEYPATEGLSFPLSALVNHLPSLQFFWLVRHPLDTICSLKVGISRNWGHHPRPPDWQAWLHRSLVEQCAHHWNYINTIGYEQVKGRATVTHFEKMIADALALALSVGYKVGLDTDRNEHYLRQWAERVQNKNNERFVEAKTSRPYSTSDHSVKVGRWRENLSREEVRRILPLVQDTAERFGYDLTEVTSL